MHIRKVAVAILALALTVVTAQPASAHTWTADTSNGAGSARFDDYGEIFDVCDNATDGYRVVLAYTTTPSQTAPWTRFHNSTGGCKRLDLSYAEGTRVHFFVCLRAGAYGTDLHCGDVEVGTA